MQRFGQSLLLEEASMSLQLAQHILDLYKHAPFLSVHDPPLTTTFAEGCAAAGFDLPILSVLQKQADIDPGFLDALLRQLPASPAVLVEAAAVVAAATGDAMAVGLVLHGVSAIQRGHLEYPGDIVSLECLR
jgi:hypothetical protein